MKKLFSSKGQRIGLVLVLVLVAAAVAGYFIYTNNNKPEDEMTQIKSAVGRHLVLPTDETPALLTVIDASKLTSEFLRAKAKNDDRILIYQKNQRVIIYRPTIDRIIDVGPAVIDNVESKDR